MQSRIASKLAQVRQRVKLGIGVPYPYVLCSRGEGAHAGYD